MSAGLNIMGNTVNLHTTPRRNTTALSTLYKEEEPMMVMLMLSKCASLSPHDSFKWFHLGLYLIMRDVTEMSTLHLQSSLHNECLKQKQ